MSWSKLPAELRLEVLECFADVSYNDWRALAKYATVSSEWQICIESHTMRSIEVTRSEIDAFRFIFRIKRRRRCLRNIGLILELDDRIPQFFFDGHTREQTIGHMWAIATRGATLTHLASEALWRNRTFSHSVRALLCELSTWKTEHVWYKGIGLEMIAKSRSYWQKKARELRPSIDPVVYGIHSFNTLQQEKILEAAGTDFDFALDLVSELPFALAPPQVQVITSLSVLRKSVRHFHPRGLAQLMEYLPSLRTFIWEAKPRAYWKTEHAFQEELSKTIKNWPSGLNDVRISQPSPFGSHLIDSPSLSALSSNLADRAQYLSCLSLSRYIDAVEFFKPAKHGFPNLQYLTLWSKQLVLDELPSCSHYLLRLTAKAVCCMPMLRNLTLYNVGGDHVGLLTYEISDNMLVLNLCCSWCFEIREGTVKFVRDSLKRERSEPLRWGLKILPAERVRDIIESTLRRNNLSLEQHRATT